MIWIEHDTCKDQEFMKCLSLDKKSCINVGLHWFFLYHKYQGRILKGLYLIVRKGSYQGKPP